MVGVTWVSWSWDSTEDQSLVALMDLLSTSAKLLLKFSNSNWAQANERQD